MDSFGSKMNGQSPVQNVLTQCSVVGIDDDDVLIGKTIASPAPGKAGMTSALVTKLSMNADLMDWV